MPANPYIWTLKTETAAESLRILKEVEAKLIPKQWERCALADALVSGTPCADLEWSLEIQEVSFQLPGTGGQLEVTCTPVFAWVVWVNGIPFAARVRTAVNDIGAVGDWGTLEVLGVNAVNENKGLYDIGSISRLRNLRILHLARCKSLSDLSGLEGLTALQSLDLGHCDSLCDLRGLEGLTALQSLNLEWCEQLSGLSGLEGLTALQSLNLGHCKYVSDLSELEGLTALQSLDLGHLSKYVSDLSVLEGLTALQSLDLSNWDSLSDLSGLAGLTALQSLYLNFCDSLSDLSGLAGLTALQSLDLGYCGSLSDLSVLAGLTSLQYLGLRFCKSLSDLSLLEGLTALRSLDLSHCKYVSDLSELEGLTALRSLDLSNCESLSDLSGLAGLTALQSLDLSSCESLSDLSGLAGLTALQTLYARDCNRVRTIETLRGCTDLRDLKVSIHPTILAELLSDLAGKRRDLQIIQANAAGWLKEAKSSLRENLPESEVFAASLARAFALLGDTSTGDEFQTFLQSAPDFPVKPWKDWFLTTKRESGFDLLQRRIDAIPPAELSPGAIGGASAALPDDQASQQEQTWARAWLAAIEQYHADRGSALRPAAAELCLALARLGEFAALDRWLQRFTDPDDSSAVDQVHAALAAWHLAALRIDDALAHVAATASSDYRDPVLAEVARFLCDAEPVRASETLLLIGAESVRGELVREFAEKPAMVDTPEAVHRLLVAAGTDGETLGWLIRQVATQRPDDAVLQALSREVQPDPAALSDWQLGQWEVLRKHWLLRHEARFGTKQ